jgi:DNA-binding transcriptional regulator YiaG
MPPAKRKSRILAAVHETARDLFEAGLISPERMQHFDKLCGRDDGVASQAMGESKQDESIPYPERHVE